MKKFLSKFSDFTLTIILEGIIGVVAVALSFIGFMFGQYGWTIGIATGTVLAMLSTVMVFKGSDAAIRENKTGLYLLFYFLRMIFFIGIMVVFALLQYKMQIEAFYFSIWGALIGYTPMFILLIVGQIKGTHDLDKKIQEKNKEE
ncbi:MAG: hypothetical protein MJ222_01725 [Bacilli bacterium]|nr:hypothetical protein [Bacilli bacterium]